MDERVGQYIVREREREINRQRHEEEGEGGEGFRVSSFNPS